MTPLEKRSLDALFSGDLPNLCNVYVRVKRAPKRISKGGDDDRWQINVTGLDSTSRTAFIAVHYTPDTAAVRLPYRRTARALLDLFENQDLQQGFEPGQELLVQAVPKWSSRPDGDGRVLFLNVQAILLLRPFFMVGRRQVDFNHPCPRKAYLHYTKAPNTRGSSQHWGSVGGIVAHEIVESLARGQTVIESSDDDIFMESVTAETKQRLVLLCLMGEEQHLKSAVKMGFHALGSIRNVPPLSDFLLATTNWDTESSALNNGVEAAPDLLREGAVAELKHINPTSEHFKPDRFRRQVESYLAWAMIEFGVPHVCADWKGFTVHLHSQVPADQRIVEYSPQMSFISQRIQNRHRTILLASGRWLPAPGEHCNRCSFAQPSGAMSNSLPPPCQFHCQTERHWDCIRTVEGQPQPCPLIGICRQHSQYHPYERLDFFNQLRKDLIEEDEELSAIEQMVQFLTTEEASGWHLPDFEIVENRRGLLRLKIPEDLNRYGGFTPGVVFNIESAEGRRILASVRLRRRKKDTLIFVLSRAIPLPSGATVHLRRRIEARYPIRHQLQFLDELQRRGREPPALRIGRTRTPVAIHRYGSVNEVPQDARLVVIDQPNRRRALTIADSYVRGHSESGSLLVIGGTGMETLRANGYANLDTEAIHELVEIESGSALTRLTQVAHQLRSRTVFFFTLEDLHDGVLDGWRQPISTILIPDAERFSLLAFQRCVNLEPERLVLIGQALARGPRAASPKAQISLLFQNPLQFLIEVGAYALPEVFSDMHLVQPTTIALAKGVTHPKLESRRTTETPCQRILVDNAGVVQQAHSPLKIIHKVEGTQGSQRRLSIVVEMTSSERVPVARLRALLKNVSGGAIEKLQNLREGDFDTTLLGERIKIVSVLGFTTNHPVHDLELHLPRDTFRFLSEHSRVNLAEAEALIDEAKSCVSPIAVSPFRAQCLLIARMAAEQNVNMRVFSCDELVGDASRSTLLLSTVVEQDEADGSFPYPLSDTAFVVPVFLTDCAQIKVFCSPSVAEFHPLIRAIPDGVNR